MKQLFLLVLSITISTSLFAQADEAGARTCLGHYMSGEAARIEQAFHPSATMKYVDYKTGEFKDVPIADYIARVKANSSTKGPERKIEIISLNVEGSAAQAKIRIETDKTILYDYMNLLKIGGEWKIVSKIFSRSDK